MSSCNNLHRQPCLLPIPFGLSPRLNWSATDGCQLVTKNHTFPIPGPNHILVSLDKPVNNNIVQVPNGSNQPTTESVTGICNRAAGIMGVAVATFCHCGSRRQKTRKPTIAEMPDHKQGEGFAVKRDMPMSRLGRVLYRLRPSRRKSAGPQVRELPADEAYIRSTPDNDLDGRHVPRFELESNEYRYHYGHGDGIQDLGTGWAQNLSPYELACSDMEGQLQGPVPAWISSLDKSEQDVCPVGHYRPDGASLPVSVPSFEFTNAAIPFMPSPAMPHPSDSQNRRFDLPSPLIIVPDATPGSFVRNHPVGTSNYMPYSPYEYYSPRVASPVPSISSDDDFASTGPQSLYSSNSNRSSQPPHSPLSIQSTGPAPSMSRSISSEHAEARSLPPPTPTYPQSQRAPIDSDNIICLGPLPDNIFLAQLSPNHTQFPPHPPGAKPRAVKPFEEDTAAIWPTYPHQDPLLHDSSPLPPYQSPVSPIFTHEHPSLHAAAHRYHGGDVDDQGWWGGLGPHRRRSTDSLGSNFTVEEEARIQAQIVRNLSMLGQERVGGEGDMVHIPQPPERRFSFDEDRTNYCGGMGPDY